MFGNSRDFVSLSMFGIVRDILPKIYLGLLLVLSLKHVSNCSWWCLLNINGSLVMLPPEHIWNSSWCCLYNTFGKWRFSHIVLTLLYVTLAEHPKLCIFYLPIFVFRLIFRIKYHWIYCRKSHQPIRLCNEDFFPM